MKTMHRISSTILQSIAISTIWMAASAPAALIYTWTGASNGNWQTSANWDAVGQPPFGGTTTSLDRLNVKNGTKNPLIYTSAEGTTTFNRLVVGTDGIRGEMTMTGGAFITTTGGDLIGNNASTATLTIDGADYTTSSPVALNNSANAPAILNIISGSATMTQLQMKSSLTNPNQNSTVNLDGGTLSFTSLLGNTHGTNDILNLNGGTLKTKAALNATTFNVDIANVRNGGAFIDSNGFNSTISEGLLHSSIVGDNATDGGLTKNGTGTLTLSGTNTYTGATTVNQGTLTCSTTSEMRFALKSNLTCNTVQGVGTANFNGLFRIAPASGPSVFGEWQLVNVATLTETFHANTFGLAFVNGPAFTNVGGGIYASDNWKFNTATGILTRMPIATVIVVL